VQSTFAELDPRLQPQAPEFVPSWLAGSFDQVDLDDPLAMLSPSCHQYLRGDYWDASGEWLHFYVGRLKNFNQAHGYGFIECKQSFADYNRDVFIHKSMMLDFWHLGAFVEFRVMFNDKQQPQAMDVQWLPAPEPGALAAPSTPTGNIPACGLLPMARTPLNAIAQATLTKLASADPVTDQAFGPAQRNPVPPRPPGVLLSRPQQLVAASGGRGPPVATGGSPRGADAESVKAQAKPQQRFLGKPKSYSSGQGYGFLLCAELWEVHKRDVYFHKSVLPPGGWIQTMTDCTVEFSVVFNDKNEPQAHNVNWDPIPRMRPSKRSHNGRPAVAEGQPPSKRTLQLLDTILKALQAQDLEKAMVHAVDAMEHSDQKDVDFIVFVIDRLKAPSVAKGFKDFVKMLMLIVLSQALKRLLLAHQESQPEDPRQAALPQKLLPWLEVAAQIEPRNDKKTLEHFPKVVGRVAEDLKAAKSFAVSIPELQETCSDVMKALEAKCHEIQQPFPARARGAAAASSPGEAPAEGEDAYARACAALGLSVASPSAQPRAEVTTRTVTEPERRGRLSEQEAEAASSSGT
jgi:cold shock CspA family protein